jgi:hypothetical protein
VRGALGRRGDISPQHARRPGDQKTHWLNNR